MICNTDTFLRNIESNGSKRGRDLGPVNKKE